MQQKSFSSDTTFGGKIPLEIFPKAFKIIDVVTLGIGEFTFAMVYQTMHTPVGRNPSISSPGIRADYRTTSNPLIYQGSRILASVPGTTSAHTSPCLYKIPNTEVFCVSLPLPPEC